MNELAQAMQHLGLEVTEVAPVGAASPTKKHVSSAELAQFLREREGQGLPKLERLPWVVRQVERGIAFDGCQSNCHLGIYVGPKYARVCFRCGGTGTISDRKALSNRQYDMARDSGTLKGHYSQHNNAYC